jgi:hypothetical protein
MPTPTTIGGSSSVTLDLSVNTSFALTGLDSLGNPLSRINVRILKGITTASACEIYLPLISSLNYRSTQFNIDNNDFDGTTTVHSGTTIAETNYVNGESSLILLKNPNLVTPITSSSTDNWTIPALVEAP